MAWTSAALALGFLHGLGADHLMAIAILAVAPGVSAADRQARAFRVAIGFAIGHALFLSAAVGMILALGWTLSPLVERGGEVLGGLLLVVLGIAGLWGVVSGRVYGHTHAAGFERPTVWHLHIGTRHRGTGLSAELPTLLGAAFAVSSLRSLSILEPFGEAAAGIGAQSLGLVLALIATFAVGVLLAMCLFGIVLARLLSARALDALGQGAAVITALGAIALGTYWMLAQALAS